MLRTVLLLLALSFTLLFSMPFLQWFVAKLYVFEIALMHQTGSIFSNSYVGIIIRQIVTLTLVPLLIAGIPAGIYWLFRRRTLPYLQYLIWTLWLMLVLVLACHK